MFSIFILFCDYCGNQTDYLIYDIILRRKKFACRACEKLIRQRWNEIYFRRLSL